MLDWTLHMGFGVAAGVLLGAAWLAGLWFAVARLPRAQRPRLWLTATGALRLAALATALYALLAAGPAVLAGAVAGLAATRMAVCRRVARSG